MEETINEFYDIGSPGQESTHPMQLKDLGTRMPYVTLGKRGSSYWGTSDKPSKTYFRDTTDKDYDQQFINKLCSIHPPYDIEPLLEHHYNFYVDRHPEGHIRFQKHVKYVILPALEKRAKFAVYIAIINEWLIAKMEPTVPNQNLLTINQLLNKVLAYIVQNPDKNNVDATIIRDVIFNGSITFDEAQQLFLKIYRSGLARFIGYRYLAFSLEAKKYLDEGGFGGEYNVAFDESGKSSGSDTTNDEKGMKTFVTYAWGDDEHEGRVRSFTNYLRENGIHAEMDVILSQKETSTNFTRMMHMAMQYKKVIVVLSEIYKARADAFIGGVGTEFSLLINDIGEKPKKYILVSFSGRSPKIVPFGLKGNDIVDLSIPSAWETLLRKLTDQYTYEFAEVAPTFPKFGTVKIEPFKPTDPV